MMITLADVEAAIAGLESERRVIACRPDLRDDLQQLVDSYGVCGLVTVEPSGYLPDDVAAIVMKLPHFLPFESDKSTEETR